MLDRLERLRADKDALAALRQADSTQFVAFRNLQPLLTAAGAIQWLGMNSLKAADADGAPAALLGRDGAAARFAVDVSALGDESAAVLAGDGAFRDLRGAAMAMPTSDSALLAQARSLLDWHRRHGFCAVCGGPTEMTRGGAQRRCVNGACGAEHFPRVDPVVIMLAIRGDKCLVGRQAQFPPGMYSALAGFVEPGETIEEAVRREVAEEAGIKVGRVAYVESQPWPFPSNLMIGCLAEALTEEIVLDAEELEAARWITRDEARAGLENGNPGADHIAMPPPVAIAHHLVRKWVAGLEI